MSIPNLAALILCAYLVLFFGLVMVGVILIRRRRKTRWPFKEGDRLLRGPGETLRRQLIDFDEKLLGRFVCCLVTGSGTLLFALYIDRWLHLGGWPSVAVVVVVLIVTATCACMWLSKLISRRANLYLGWFGERLVAEKMRPLLASRCYVFHDVPCEEAKKSFNIDHVVVGPAGVAAIEVKTRRKGNARPGFKEHEVAFDGVKLNWPWGYDHDAISQTIRNAEWLRKWLHERTGLQVAVRPILALPGWFVHESPSREIRVVNPNYLPDVIQGRGEIMLSPQQIDLIRRQLEDRCRDVDE